MDSNKDITKTIKQKIAKTNNLERLVDHCILLDKINHTYHTISNEQLKLCYSKMNDTYRQTDTPYKKP